MTLKRIAFIQDLLAFVGLGDRLHLEWLSSSEAKRFVEVVDAFTESLRTLGPNPLNGYSLKPWMEQIQSFTLDSDTRLNEVRG